MITVTNIKRKELPKNTYYIIGYDGCDDEYPRYLGITEYYEYITFDTLEDYCSGYINYSLGVDLKEEEFKNMKEITKEEFTIAFENQINKIKNIL